MRRPLEVRPANGTVPAMFLLYDKDERKMYACTQASMTKVCLRSDPIVEVRK